MSRLGQTFSTAIVASVPASGAETVVCHAGPISAAVDSSQVLIFYMVQCTSGAGGTSLTLRLRRGTTTAGTLVNIANLFAVNGTNLNHLAGVYFDAPAGGGMLDYVLTLALNAANTITVNDVCLAVVAL